MTVLTKNCIFFRNSEQSDFASSMLYKVLSFDLAPGCQVLPADKEQKNFEKPTKSSVLFGKKWTIHNYRRLLIVY